MAPGLMEERAFFRESETTKPATLNCPFCRTADTYELRWMVRKKLDQAPRGADERDRARFAKFASYMVLLDDKAMCKNMRCRKRFDIFGVKSMAFIEGGVGFLSPPPAFSRRLTREPTRRLKSGGSHEWLTPQ